MKKDIFDDKEENAKSDIESKENKRYDKEEDLTDKEIIDIGHLNNLNTFN